jgi:hypothetical protein
VSERDTDRDPWLQAALRHAPDADAAPPPALREAILRAARTAAPPRPTWAARLDAAWGWLARPSVAAAFASLFLGTTVVLMWREPPPEAADPIARDAAVAKAPVTAPAPPRPEAAPAEPPAQAANAEAARGATQAPATVAAPPPAAAMPALPSPVAVAPATAVRPEPPSPASPAAPAPQAADPTDAAPARDAAIAAAEAPRRSAERERAAARAEAPQALAKPAPLPLEPGALWSSLTAEPGRWAVRPAEGGAARPVAGDPVFATLAARTDWKAAPGPVAPSADDRLLERDGRPAARLSFGPDGIVVAPPGGTPRALALDPATLARLRAALGG